MSTNLCAQVKSTLARVNTGIRYLDRKFGRGLWLGKINLAKFDIENEKQCICGQVFGDFWKVVWDSEEGKEENKMSEAEAHKRGFYENGTASCDLLHSMWVYRLKQLGCSL